AIGDGFNRFVANFRKSLSIDLFKDPWKKEHFVTIGNPILDSLPGEINGSKTAFTSFCQALTTATVTADFLDGDDTAPEEDRRIGSPVELNFNQVVGSLVDVEVVNSPGLGIPSGNWTLMAAFLITGTTFTGRASRSKSAEVAVWGYVTIRYVQEGLPYRRAKI